MVDAILSMSEVNRFSKGIFGWVGFRTKWIEFENVERVAGETKWSFWKLFLYSIDGIVAFSTAPLAIASVAGLFFAGSPFWRFCSSLSARWRGATGRGLAVDGLHHLAGRRHSALFYRRAGAIFVQDLSGNKEKAGLYRKGERVMEKLKKEKSWYLLLAFALLVGCCWRLLRPGDVLRERSSVSFVAD